MCTQINRYPLSWFIFVLLCGYSWTTEGQTRVDLKDKKIKSTITEIFSSHEKVDSVCLSVCFSAKTL